MAEKTVRLVKDAETGGKFYVYTARPELLHDSHAPVEIPEEIVLAAAYPTLEDYLGQPLQEVLGGMYSMGQEMDDEMQELVGCGRKTISACFKKLIRRIDNDTLVFLGMDFGLFKEGLLELAEKGTVGYLDMDGVKTEQQVAYEFGKFIPDSMRRHGRPLVHPGWFRYEFRNRKERLPRIKQLEGPRFIREVFLDFLEANEDDAVYKGISIWEEALSNKWAAFLKTYRGCVTAKLLGTDELDYSLSSQLWQETPLCRTITSLFKRLESSRRYKFK